MLRVGLISDTHGLLRPQARAFLVGCQHIVHCGDVGEPGILAELAELAPLTAVRGNNDTEIWGRALPERARLRLEQVELYALHDLAQLDLAPSAAGLHAVLTGHSHRPSVTLEQGVLFVNPGSAGPRRFKLPVAVAELTIAGASLSARIVELAV